MWSHPKRWYLWNYGLTPNADNLHLKILELHSRCLTGVCVYVRVCVRACVRVYVCSPWPYAFRIIHERGRKYDTNYNGTVLVVETGKWSQIKWTWFRQVYWAETTETELDRVPLTWKETSKIHCPTWLYCRFLTSLGSFWLFVSVFSKLRPYHLLRSFTSCFSRRWRLPFTRNLCLLTRSIDPVILLFVDY